MVISVKTVMTALADAIREKTGGADPLTIAQMTQEIRALETGGGVELPELDNPGGSGQLVEGYQMIDQTGNVVDGEIPIRDWFDVEETEDSTSRSWFVPEGFYPEGIGFTMLRFFASPPSIEVSESGTIMATSSFSKGYCAGGAATATKQLDLQYGQTITPGTETVTIPAQKFLAGAQVIEGDTNLKAENIVSGVSIFGVEGSFSLDSELSRQSTLIEQIKAALQSKIPGGEDPFALVLADASGQEFETADNLLLELNK